MMLNILLRIQLCVKMPSFLAQETENLGIDDVNTTSEIPQPDFMLRQCKPSSHFIISDAENLSFFPSEPNLGRFVLQVVCTAGIFASTFWTHGASGSRQIFRPSFLRVAMISFSVQCELAGLTSTSPMRRPILLFSFVMH